MIGSAVSDAVASAAVAQLAADIPADVVVTIRGSGEKLEVWLDDGVRSAGYVFGGVAIQEPGPDEENLRTAVEMLLNFVQDYLVLHTRDPWPGCATTLPIPHVELDAGRIIGSFGPDDPPVVSVVIP